MNVTAAAWLRTFAERLQTSGSVQSGQSLARHQLSSMYDLPVLQHQPRDKGRYLTSFVGCLKDPSGSAYNLGFYRALVTDALQIVLYVDPRTDAHRIVSAVCSKTAASRSTSFNGGPLCCYLAAAAKLPDTIDSFDAAARLQGRALRIDQSNFPPAPVEAEVVIRGVVTERRLAHGRSSIRRIQGVLLRAKLRAGGRCPADPLPPRSLPSRPVLRQGKAASP